jgi:hypothetical protein
LKPILNDSYFEQIANYVYFEIEIISPIDMSEVVLMIYTRVKYETD